MMEQTMPNPLIITLDDNSTQYTQFSYPAGESQIRLTPETTQAAIEAERIVVVAYIQSPTDIIKLALLRSALGSIAGQSENEDGVVLINAPYIQLVLPYLPYGRADRRFTPGDCSGLQTFGSLINAMQFDDVITLDAHNQAVAEFYIAHLIDKPAEPFIWQAIRDFKQFCPDKRLTVLFPDEGACKRYQMKSGRIACNVDHLDIHVAYASKKRDPVTGVLLGFDVPELPNDPVLIIDDICDGGGTFIGIAGQLKVPVRALYVTHGIFSKGVPLVAENFHRIYTTDSFRRTYAGWNHNSKLVVFPALEFLTTDRSDSAAS